MRNERATPTLALNGDNFRPFEPMQPALYLPACQARALESLGGELDGVTPPILENELVEFDQKYPCGSADLPEKAPGALMRKSGECLFGFRTSQWT